MKVKIIVVLLWRCYNNQMVFYLVVFFKKNAILNGILNGFSFFIAPRAGARVAKQNARKSSCSEKNGKKPFFFGHFLYRAGYIGASVYKKQFWRILLYRAEQNLTLDEFGCDCDRRRIINAFSSPERDPANHLKGRNSSQQLHLDKFQGSITLFFPWVPAVLLPRVQVSRT